MQPLHIHPESAMKSILMNTVLTTVLTLTFGCSSTLPVPGQDGTAQGMNETSNKLVSKVVVGNDLGKDSHTESTQVKKDLAVNKVDSGSLSAMTAESNQGQTNSGSVTGKLKQVQVKGNDDKTVVLEVGDGDNTINIDLHTGESKPAMKDTSAQLTHDECTSKLLSTNENLFAAKFEGCDVFVVQDTEKKKTSIAALKKGTALKNRFDLAKFFGLPVDDNFTEPAAKADDNLNEENKDEKVY